jgi:predicted N-acetyltransferase YhbS
MKYRSLKESDIKKIFLIGKKEFGSRSEYSWDWTIGKLKDYLRSSFGFGIVCTEKNSIIGFALVQKDYSTQKPYTAWLNYLFVDEKYREKNIGSALLDLAIARLRKLGKKDVATDVYADNRQSLYFFNSNKFRIREKWYILSRKL